MKASLFLLGFAAVRVQSQSITTESCVEPNNPLAIAFDHTDNKQFDWIGLYTPGAVSGGEAPDTKFPNWVFNCGTRSCSQSIGSGVTTIAEPDYSGSDTWVAVMARWAVGDVAPYDVVMASEPFRVKQDCTVKPTSEPPSDSLTRETTHVTTNKASYAFDESFTVSFNVDNPKRGDWVAIYPAETDSTNLKEALFWLWAGCNRQGNACNGKSSGTRTFSSGKDIAWTATWPLLPGKYRAYTLRDGDMPFEVINQSSIFEVIGPTRIGQLAFNVVRKEIEDLVTGPKGDIALASKFLRLGFHDCVGGCDGCVDMTDIHNKGLEVPIDALAPIVNKYSHIMSRADIWALSVLVGPEISQPSGGFKVDFDFMEFGRVDCEDALEKCFNKDGIEHGCSAKRGPFHEIPGANTGTHKLFDFMEEQFGFNTRETVALMGAHTIGVLSRENSGINGQDGWLLNKRRLDNEYYIELVGGRSPDDTFKNLVELAPNWRRHFESNSDLDDFDDISVWLGLPEGFDGRRIIMLNVDVALVRLLEEGVNMNPKSGKVNCLFVTPSVIKNDTPKTCPHSGNALREAARYRFDNRAWLVDFEDVIRRMLHAGYTVDGNDCFGNVCRLVPK